MIHGRLSPMTFLQSEADGFQLQTVLIKQQHENKAGLEPVCVHSPPVCAWVGFFMGGGGRNEPSLRRAKCQESSSRVKRVSGGGGG